MKCGIGVVGNTNTQELLNKIIEEIDVLLAEVCTNLSDINRFDVIKGDLRALFNELQKDIWSLKNEMGVMKNEFCAMRARVSKLETVECDVNVIRMGNLGTQLRNKMIRFIKPELSKRAARDEFLDHLQGEAKFTNLSELIKRHDPNLTVFDIARAINSLSKERARKAHQEDPIPSETVDVILSEFISSHDEYLGEQAILVVRFLKLLAESLHEPLIVHLE